MKNIGLYLHFFNERGFFCQREGVFFLSTRDGVFFFGPKQERGLKRNKRNEMWWVADLPLPNGPPRYQWSWAHFLRLWAFLRSWWGVDKKKIVTGFDISFGSCHNKKLHFEALIKAEPLFVPSSANTMP